jgi:hypothetical protein
MPYDCPGSGTQEAARRGYSQRSGMRADTHGAVGFGQGVCDAGYAGKARTAYQDFFAMWKDADPDIPVLVAAKAEYGKL